MILTHPSRLTATTNNRRSRIASSDWAREISRQLRNRSQGSRAALQFRRGMLYGVNKNVKPPADPKGPWPLFKTSRSLIYYNARQVKAKHEMPDAESRGLIASHSCDGS